MLDIMVLLIFRAAAIQDIKQLEKVRRALMLAQPRSPGKGYSKRCGQPVPSIC